MQSTLPPLMYLMLVRRSRNERRDRMARNHCVQFDSSLFPRGDLALASIAARGLRSAAKVAIPLSMHSRLDDCNHGWARPEQGGTSQRVRTERASLHGRTPWTGRTATPYLIAPRTLICPGRAGVCVCATCGGTIREGYLKFVRLAWAA